VTTESSTLSLHAALPISLMISENTHTHTHRGGFGHGRTGQLPGAALFHDTWGAALALKIYISSGTRSGLLLSIISLCGELANWRPLQLQAPLLAKKVQSVHRSCLRRGKECNCKAIIFIIIISVLLRPLV